MNRFRTVLLLALSGVLLSGCAGGGLAIKQPWCALGGAILGGGAGWVINEEALDNQDGDEASAAIGAAVGGAIASMFCAQGAVDSDGDGVPDDVDQCPGTPPGVAVDANGCPLDSDGDGVPDYLDKCPGTPPGTQVDADGCEVVGDSDGDGVPDNLDKCPGTPLGVAVDSDGCPQVGETLLILEGVNFAFNSARLTSESESLLEQAVTVLNGNPSVSVQVEGHTDHIGSDAYNQRLSERRADSVVAYLVGRGIDPARLSPVGRGESEPIASNDTEDGRYRNRRVEFVVTSK